MSRSKASFNTRLRNLFRTYRLPMSAAVLAVGAFLSITAFAAYTPLLTDVPFSQYVPSLLGPDCPASSNICPASPGPVDWVLAFVVVGALLDIIGLYLVVAYIVARRRFEHLMKTKSKAEFLRNITEVEDLLWDLTPEDEIRLVRKKQELRVRD